MIKKSPYNVCLAEMYSLRRFGIKLGLATIKKILNGLGNPHDRFSTIHIAGTNGKGSIASALATILHQAGYNVGLYTSPHLVKFNERICINKQPISDDDVVSAYEAVRDVNSGEREPTFFEFATAMALYEFDRRKVDWAIIETGMGGRLDATNILSPALSGISNISVEHKEYLGHTIREITGEKGGIIKKGIPVVTGVRQKTAISVVTEIARKQTAPLFCQGNHFRVRKSNGTSFTYFGIQETWRHMTTALPGRHQLQNAALTLAACEIINKNNLANLPLEAIRYGLSHNHWPGRLEVVCQSPYVILDGAHNLAAARNLADFLSVEMKDRKITMVMGVLDDKPYQAILKSLLSVCTRAILTSPAIDRALDPETLLAAAGDVCTDITTVPRVADAVRHAIDTAGPDEVICIAGSLYVVGEAKEVLDLSGMIN
jgi:dihydrofolate synthase / folylpolyglutamate synthase